VALLATWVWREGFPLGGLVYGCLVGCALMWRRRRPVAVFVAVSLVSIGMVPVEVNSTRLYEGMVLLPLAVAMYAVVVYASTLRAGVLVGIVAVVVSAALSTWWRSLEYPDAPSDFRIALLGALTYGVVVWSVALIARTRRLHVLGRAERAATAERERDHLARIAVAEERARIARELHDIVAHSLSVMIVHANGAEYAFDRDPERARAALRTIGATGRDALGEIKQLVQILRGDGGDPAADRSPAALDQVGAVVERARGAGLAVDLAVDGTPPQVPGGVALAVYRIVQEALTNTLRHARATRAEVVLRLGPESLDVDVQDNGRPATIPTEGGHGLVGMRERATMLGGSFEAGPLPGGGYRVHARLPLEATP
jgi:signal transduction histidine kinase